MIRKRNSKKVWEEWYKLRKSILVGLDWFGKGFLCGFQRFVIALFLFKRTRWWISMHSRDGEPSNTPSASKVCCFQRQLDRLPFVFAQSPIGISSFDLKYACNSVGSSRSTNNYAATPTVFSRQSQFRLTVKMAPTIEYPAQHCEASPKSLHMVLFYITNIFVLVLFVYDPVRNTATIWLESLGYCCYCCYCSIGDAIHNPPAVYYRRATSKMLFASRRKDRFPNGAIRVGQLAVLLDTYKTFRLVYMRNNRRRRAPKFSNESLVGRVEPVGIVRITLSSTIWGSNESKISCEKESIVLVTVKRTIKMYTS